MMGLTLIPGASVAKRGNGSTGLFRSWKVRQKLEIKSSQVDGTLTNFPVLLDETILNNLNFDIWSIALNGGGDLRFSSDVNGNTRLACEVVSFDTGAQTAEIYVNVPSISAVIDTPIYIFYGRAGQTQPAAGAAFGRNATWNSDYIFVDHMNNGTDSTGNTSLMAFSGTVVAGKVGSAVDFDGSSNVIDYGALVGPAGEVATIEFWSNFDVINTGTLQHICGTDDNVNTFEVNQRAAANGCGFFADPPVTVVESSWGYTANVWQHTSLHINATATVPQVTFRLNYNDAVSTPAFNNQTLRIDRDFTVGARWNGSAFDRWMDGGIDELRISKVLRAIEWRKASYINQNLTTNFLQVAPVVS